MVFWTEGISMIYDLFMITTLIERFLLRDHWAYFSTKTKENVCIRITFNSGRINWGYQHGRRDVKWKHSIPIHGYFAIFLLCDIF